MASHGAATACCAFIAQARTFRLACGSRATPAPHPLSAQVLQTIHMHCVSDNARMPAARLTNGAILEGARHEPALQTLRHANTRRLRCGSGHPAAGLTAESPHRYDAGVLAEEARHGG